MNGEVISHLPLLARPTHSPVFDVSLPSPSPIERISFTPRSLSLPINRPHSRSPPLMRAIVRPVNGGDQRATWFISSFFFFFFSTKSFLIDRKLGTLNAHPRGTTRPNGDRNRDPSEGLSTSIVRRSNVDTRARSIHKFHLLPFASVPLSLSGALSSSPRFHQSVPWPIDEREAPPPLSWTMFGVDPRLPINLR